MKSNKIFDHFVIFKVTITTIYIASGFLMFGMLAVNATSEFEKLKKERQYQQIDCMNCDEID